MRYFLDLRLSFCLIYLQSYVRVLKAALARVPVTLQAAFDMSADESFTGRLLKFNDDGKRVLGEYDTFLILCG